MLALEGRYETFTVGRDIEWEKVKEIYRLGLRHGMRLAASHSANPLAWPHKNEKAVPAFPVGAPLVLVVEPCG